jgi:hypothetical protein
MSEPGRRQGLSLSAGKSASRSVWVMGLPVAGWMGSASMSRVDVWWAGYSEPGLREGFVSRGVEGLAEGSVRRIGVVFGRSNVGLVRVSDNHGG